jgi:hypothetical protein
VIPIACSPRTSTVPPRPWAHKLGMSEADIREYLISNIHYYLDDPCLDGLRLFYRLAYECSALPEAPDLHFADVKPALI